MEPRIKNGWLRAILFIPIWMIIMGLTSAVGVVLVMLMNGIDLNADPNGATALFENMSFDSPVMLFLTAFQVVGSFLALWFMMSVVNREPLMNIGLSFENRGKEMLVGLGSALAFIGGIFLILWMIGAVNVTGFVGFKPGVFIVSMMLFLAAFDEEIIFRGYILKNMMDGTDSRWIALGGSSVLFALLHAGNPGVFSTFVPMSELFAAGFILGISYTFTKNLWFPTFFHFGWNFFQGLFGFEISGLDVDSWKMIAHENTGNVPDIVSGGSFGIEGSVISLCCTILGTYVIWKYYIDNE